MENVEAIRMIKQMRWIGRDDEDKHIEEDGEEREEEDKNEGREQEE